jgi:hypothetical protein
VLQLLDVLLLEDKHADHFVWGWNILQRKPSYM